MMSQPNSSRDTPVQNNFLPYTITKKDLLLTILHMKKELMRMLLLMILKNQQLKVKETSSSNEGIPALRLIEERALILDIKSTDVSSYHEGMSSSN